jgi:hypothetical protein
MEKNRRGLLVAKNRQLETWARGVVSVGRQAGTFPQSEQCALCPAPGIAHHEDYAKPLEVIWLCKSHHRQRHQSEDEPDRITPGWRIRRDLKDWVNVEAARRRLVPRDVIEQLIEVMKELTHGSHHECDSLEEARQKECEICLSRLP